jgi:hypothetical protein
MTKKKTPPPSELDDDLEQLLIGLKLPQIREVLQRELGAVPISDSGSYACPCPYAIGRGAPIVRNLARMPEV